MRARYFANDRLGIDNHICFGAIFVGGGCGSCGGLLVSEETSTLLDVFLSFFWSVSCLLPVLAYLSLAHLTVF